MVLNIEKLLAKNEKLAGPLISESTDFWKHLHSIKFNVQIMFLLFSFLGKAVLKLEMMKMNL